MPKYRQIIFDLDGTLLDSRQDIIAAVNFGRKETDLPVLADQEIIPNIGHGIGYLVDECFKDTGVSPEKALPIVKNYYQEHPHDKATLYPNVQETLPKVASADRLLHICSNKPRELIQPILDHFGLSKLFSVVIGGEDMEIRKPHPMSVEYILDRHEDSPSKVLMVGDHSPDIQMAHNAGIDSAYCQYGFFGQDTDKSTYKLNEFSDLLDII